LRSNQNCINFRKITGDPQGGPSLELTRTDKMHYILKGSAIS